MNKTWRLLLVDDEPDVHAVVRMALRRRRLAGRRFEWTSAFSQAEAEDLLWATRNDPFDLVLTDGVMEDMGSGFSLADLIHNELGLDIPVVLHAGIYSESYVRFHYGALFDAVMAKAATTADRLFEVIGACLSGHHRTGPPPPSGGAWRTVAGDPAMPGPGALFAGPWTPASHPSRIGGRTRRRFDPPVRDLVDKCFYAR